MTLVISRVFDIRNATYFGSPLELERHLAAHPEVETLIFVVWSWKVSDEMLQKYKCYGLHTGPLLEGRGKGGSPIRNLRKLGVQWATLCAFEMTSDFDEGSVKVAVPIHINTSEDMIWSQIDKHLPAIVAYLTQPYVEVPVKFRRLPSAI